MDPDLSLASRVAACELTSPPSPRGAMARARAARRRLARNRVVDDAETVAREACAVVASVEFRDARVEDDGVEFRDAREEDDGVEFGDARRRRRRR